MTNGEAGPGLDWLVEQRYRAVLEVLNGSPVTEVAVRYGVSRQAVYGWKTRHRRRDGRAAGGVEAAAVESVAGGRGGGGAGV